MSIKSLQFVGDEVPCDLWMLKAQARIRGTWKRVASAKPFAFSMLKFVGIQSLSCPFWNLTKGQTLESLLQSFGTGGSCISTVVFAEEWTESLAAYEFVMVLRNPSTIPTLPLTRPEDTLRFLGEAIEHGLTLNNHQIGHLYKHNLSSDLDL